MNKKGYTLIEILTVIIVLGVIAVITVPIMIGTIFKTEKSSYKDSMYGIIESAKLYLSGNMDTIDEEDEIVFVCNGESCEYNGQILYLKGKTPISGTIAITGRGDTTLENVYNGKYCASGTKSNLTVVRGECDASDTTPPIISNVIMNPIKSREATVIISASDSESGIKKYLYCLEDSNGNCEYKEGSNKNKLKNLTPDTQYTMRVKVENGAGISSDEFVKTFKTISIEKATFEVSSNNYAGSKIVTIHYPDNVKDEEGNDLYEYSYEIEGLETGEKNSDTVGSNKVELKVSENSKIKAIIKYGENEVTSSLIIAGVDTKGPRVKILNKDSWEKVKTIKIKAVDEEGSGLAKKAYSYNGGKTWTSNSSQEFSLIQTILIRVRDRLGNLSSDYEICDTEESFNNDDVPCSENNTGEIVISKIDDEPPVCELEVKNNMIQIDGWYQGDVEVGFKESGTYDTAKYGEDLVSAKPGSGIKTRSISQANVTANGVTKVTAKVEDNAGNEGTCSIDIQLRRSKPGVPSATIRYDNSSGTVRGSVNSWTNRTLWLGEFRATSVVEIDHYEYSTGCTGSKSGNLSSSHTYSDTVDYTFCIRSVDKAGNASDWSSPYYIKVDKIAPSVPSSTVRYDSSSGTIRGNSSAWTNRTLWWGSFSGSDSHSKIDHYEYSTGCTGSKSGNLSSSHTYSSTGNNEFCIRSVDKAGNVSGWSGRYYFRVDKTPPSTPSVYNPTGGNWTNQNFSLTVSSTDVGSGIAYYQYSYDNGNWTTYGNSNSTSFTTTPFSAERNQPAYIRACDNVGNCSNSSSTYIRIDKTAPTAPTIAGGGGELNSDTVWLDFGGNGYSLVNENFQPKPIISGVLEKGPRVIYISIGSSAASDINKYQYCINSTNSSSGCVWTDLHDLSLGVDWPVFDPTYYAMYNVDVRNAYGTSAFSLYDHFSKYGMNEGRRASRYFDFNTYKNNNADLINAFGSDNKSYYNHYVNYGRFEGRNAGAVSWFRNAQLIERSGLNYVFFRAVSNAGNVSSASNPQKVSIMVSVFR